VFIFEPDPISVQVDATPAFPGLFNGTATVMASGGTTPYYYLWDESAGSQTGQTATGLDTGNYYVTITDYNQCEKKALVIVPMATSTLFHGTDPGPVPRIFPNPASRLIRLGFDEPGPEIDEIKMFDMTGQEIQAVHWKFDATNGQWYLSVDDFRPGVYLVQVRAGRTIHSLRVIILR
jgi:hypothetical protein